MQLKIYIPQHPLVIHLVNMVQSIDLPPSAIKISIVELSYWLFYEATKDWLELVSVEFNSFDGLKPANLIDPGVHFYAIPIFKSGLLMTEAITKLFSSIQILYISFQLQNNINDISPEDNVLFHSIPTKSKILIFDSVVLRSDKILAILSQLSLQQIQFSSIKLVFILCTSNVLQDIAKEYPNLTIHTACIKDIQEPSELIPYKKLQDYLFIYN
nr:hypothetical protein [Erythrocladia irregularis]